MMYNYDQHLKMLQNARDKGLITGDEVVRFFESKAGVEEARLILADFLAFLVRSRRD